MTFNLQHSASRVGTKNPPPTGGGGTGGIYTVATNLFSPPDGAGVAARTMDIPASSTADYYHVDGLTDLKPYDLSTMGSWGANIVATEGYRYVWFINLDHPADGSGEEGGWAYDGWHIYAAFSNDPTIPPDPRTMRAIISGQNTVVPGITGLLTRCFQCRFVYNPDDPTTPAWIYLEGMSSANDIGLTNSLNMWLAKNSDFNTQFTPVSVSHICNYQFGLTGYQHVYRLGTGNWVSWGGGNPHDNDGSTAKWTSTDGVTFTLGAQAKVWLNAAGAAVGGAAPRGWISHASPGNRFQIGTQWYGVANEDLRGPNWDGAVTYAINEQACVNTNHVYKSLSNSNINHDPISSPTWWQDLGLLGQYVSLVPIDDTTGDVNFTGTPPFIRISPKFDGFFPSASYLQYVSGYVEDGIYFAYAIRAMFGDVGVGSANRNKLPENGGGSNEQYCDIYAYVFDTTAAATSAPFGVQASCTNGVVTISWKDIPAGRTYRVARGTVAGTYGTPLGDITGTSITDSPTPTGVVYYYQVTSLIGSVAQKSRRTFTFVS